MQVTMRHRQAGAGSFFVDCEVKLSEEEKAIIYQRGLGNRTITVPSGISGGSGINPDSIFTRIIGLAAIFCVIIGTILLLLGLGIWQARGWAALWLTIGIGTIVWLRLSHRRYFASGEDQRIPLQQILSNPLFTVAAHDLDQARSHENRIRSVLTDMKQFLVSNAQVKEVETFEL